NLNSLVGAVTLDGQAGTDTVNVYDQANANGDTYTISYFQLTRAFFGGLNYAGGEEGMTLCGETGNNTININSTNFFSPVTVNAGAGNDTINVGTGFEFPVGAVTVNGQRGTDKVNVNDQTGDDSHTYTVTGTTLDREDAPGLTFVGI